METRPDAGPGMCAATLPGPGPPVPPTERSSRRRRSRRGAALRRPTEPTWRERWEPGAGYRWGCRCSRRACRRSHEGCLRRTARSRRNLRPRPQRGSRSSRRALFRRFGTGGCQPVRWRSRRPRRGRPGSRPTPSASGRSRGRRPAPRPVRAARPGREPAPPVPAGVARPGRPEDRQTAQRGRSGGRRRSGVRPVGRRGRADPDRRPRRRRGTGRVDPGDPTTRPPPWRPARRRASRPRRW